MGIGTSVFLMAVGAILTFAVHVDNPSGFNLHTIGVILMVVGAIGAVLSLIFANSIGSMGRGRRTIVEDDIV